MPTILSVHLLKSKERYNRMIQIISKNGKVLCTTTVPYPKEIIKQMKNSGYKVIEKEQSK